MPPRAPIIGRALGLVRDAIRPLQTTHRPTRILVACSGGADSTALLGLLHLLARPDGLKLSVGSVDHGLRAASAAEVAGVQALAARWGLPFEQRRLELQPGSGLPARARAARYDALTAMAEATGSEAIALGHTATDQAETVLLHLSRGAALDGLAAMPTVDTQRPVTVVRPMLQLTRPQSRELCAALELRFVDDPSNEDLEQPRIAIRRDVLPRLTSLRPAADLAIASSAALARDADEALAVWAERECASREVANGVRADDALRELPVEVLRRVIRTLGLRAGVDRDALGRRLLRDICRAVRTQGPPRTFDVKGDVQFVVKRDWMGVVVPKRKLPP